MSRYIRPTHLAPSFLDVPFEELLAGGVRVFLSDIDNTLGNQGCQAFAPEVEARLKWLSSQGAQVCLASNNPRNRSHLADTFGGDYVHAGFCRGIWVPRKPNPRFFMMALEIVGGRPEEAVMIGDKYFFDVNPALRMGIKGVLVNPCGPDLIGDRLMGIRHFENVVLAGFGLKRP